MYIVCIVARLILPCSLIPLGQERKKGEKERVPPYRECLRGLESVLRDQEEEGSRRKQGSLAEPTIACTIRVLVFLFSGLKVSISNSSLSMIQISC